MQMRVASSSARTPAREWLIVNPNWRSSRKHTSAVRTVTRMFVEKLTKMLRTVGSVFL